MTRIRSLAIPAVALLAVLAVAGCKKKEPAAEAPAATPPPVAAEPAHEHPTTEPMPQAPALASVAGIELGNAAGKDMKITSPKSTFAPKDKIIVAVSTKTADLGATVPAKLSTKWTHTDSNQTVNEESRDVQLKGNQVYDFEITNTDPWPTGNYRVDVMLDGNVVQARGFEVK
jgi:hypothetical protein